MRFPRQLLVASASLLIALSLECSTAFADGKHRGDDERQQGVEDRVRVSLDEAVRRAEQRFNARVVKAETRRLDGRVMHILRLVSGDGRVFTVRVDAQTGSMD